MDVVISQYDRSYLDALIRYNKALAQRNALLKCDDPVDGELFSIWGRDDGERGNSFTKEIGVHSGVYSIFQNYYSYISQERLWICLMNHAAQGNLHQSSES